MINIQWFLYLIYTCDFFNIGKQEDNSFPITQQMFIEYILCAKSLNNSSWVWGIDIKWFSFGVLSYYFSQIYFFLVFLFVLFVHFFVVLKLYDKIVKLDDF